MHSPGRLAEAELGRSKAEVYQGRYETFRYGLSIKQKFIDASCSGELDGVTFAFICVDKGTARAGIVDLLLSRGIPFIDVGMGLRRNPDGLNGMIRTTYFSPECGAALREAGLMELVDRPDDLYHDNIRARRNRVGPCFLPIGTAGLSCGALRASSLPSRVGGRV